MSYIYRVIIGNWQAGHQSRHETTDITIKTNLTKDQVNSAYKIACDITGIDLFNILHDCEHVTALDAVELNQLDLHCIDLPDTETVKFSQQDVFDILMKFIKMGNNEFIYEEIWPEVLFDKTIGSESRELD